MIAVTLLAAMVRGPIGVKLAPYHLSYRIRLPDGLVIVALYVVAVCGPLLVSGYRSVALFGVVNLVAVIVSARSPFPGSPPCGAGGQPFPAPPSRWIAASPDPILSALSPDLADSFPPADRRRRAFFAGGSCRCRCRTAIWSGFAAGFG